MRSDQLDSYRTAMDAGVTAVRAEGGQVWASLDDSLFYPTSGGQPHDTGRLVHAQGVARVVDVVADGPDAVRHRVEGEIPAEGADVRVEIDWQRRYRHMQRHTAQHLLSQAFLRIGPAFETRSVSLASPDATLDLAGEPDEDAIAAAFGLARDWAYRTLAVDAFEIDEEEVGHYPLRRPPKVSGRIRLVRIGDVELSACGGTHLRTSAETLPMLALGRQKIRGGLTRVTFRAGLEAGERADAAVATLDELARSFSGRWDEVEARVAALRDELREARRAAEAARGAWAELRVRDAAGADHADDRPPLLRIVADGPSQLAALAEAAARTRPAAVALLAAHGDGRATLLFQAGPDLGDGVDLRPALTAALPFVGGRGGGKPDRVQGSGPDAGGIEAALDAAEEELARANREPG